MNTLNELNEEIKRLENIIHEIEESNISIYKKYQFDWSIGKNKETHIQWLKGSENLKNHMNELYKLLDKRRDLRLHIENKENNKSVTFVNSYGEATKREITASTYNRSQKRLENQVLRNLGL